MRRHSRSDSRPVVLRREFPVEVRPATFHVYESVRHLDVERLSRAKRAKFELGYVESGCCRRVIYAIVERGRVVKLQPEPCTHPKTLSPEMARLVRDARAALDKRRQRRGFRAMSVRQFFDSSQAFTIDVSFCFIICIFDYCLLCCYSSDPGPIDWNGCDFGRWPALP